MAKCLVCGSQVPDLGNPPYVVRHVNPREHYINTHRWWTPSYELREDMPCKNCGYKMRFITGRWVCDSCTHTETPEAPALPNLDLESDRPNPPDSFDIMIVVGREIHGDNFTLASAPLTPAQELRLVEVSLEIQKAIVAYRSDKANLIMPTPAPYRTDSSRPLGY